MTDLSAAPPAPGAGTFSVGGVLKRSFKTYFANFIPFTILALILYLPSLFFGLSTGFNMEVGVSVDTGFESPYSATDVVAMILSVLLSYVLIGALVYGTVQYLNGHKAGLGELIGRGLSRAIPVLVIAILASLAFGIGFALLIVPGVFLIVVWSVAIPASVVERPGIIGSFKRSWNLTKGYRWPVLGILLILLVIMIVFSMIVGAAGGAVAFTTGSFGFLFILNYLISALTGTLMAVMIAVLYHDLRVAKEGVSTAQLAAVFD